MQAGLTGRDACSCAGRYRGPVFCLLVIVPCTPASIPSRAVLLSRVVPCRSACRRCGGFRLQVLNGVRVSARRRDRRRFPAAGFLMLAGMLGSVVRALELCLKRRARSNTVLSASASSVLANDVVRSPGAGRCVFSGSRACSCAALTPLNSSFRARARSRAVLFSSRSRVLACDVVRLFRLSLTAVEAQFTMRRATPWPRAELRDQRSIGDPDGGRVRLGGGVHGMHDHLLQPREQGAGNNHRGLAGLILMISRLSSLSR